VAERDGGVLAIGYFGSYARGDWGVGSDIDLVVVKAVADEPFERRALAYDATGLPVPADVLVYGDDEWQRMLARGGFARTVAGEIVWVVDRRK
jgi:predicted nucleotidyltransferase